MDLGLDHFDASGAIDYLRHNAAHKSFYLDLRSQLLIPFNPNIRF